MTWTDDDQADVEHALGKQKRPGLATGAPCVDYR